MQLVSKEKFRFSIDLSEAAVKQWMETAAAITTLLFMTLLSLAHSYGPNGGATSPAVSDETK